MNGHDQPTAADTQHLRLLATTYRRMVAVFGVGWLAAMMINSSASTPGGNSNLLFLAGLAIGLVLAFHGYQVAEHLGLAAPPLWAIGMFIPLISLLCLLILSRKATAYCRTRGVRVGFLGPNLEDIQKLEELAQARTVSSNVHG